MLIIIQYNKLASNHTILEANEQDTNTLIRTDDTQRERVIYGRVNSFPSSSFQIQPTY